MAAANVVAVQPASDATSASSSTWIAESAPIDSALRRASFASAGPIETTTTSTLLSASFCCSATSIARSLISSMIASLASRSTRPSGVSLRSPYVSGTCLMSTAIFTDISLSSSPQGHLRIQNYPSRDAAPDHLWDVSAVGVPAYTVSVPPLKVLHRTQVDEVDLSVPGIRVNLKRDRGC